MNPQPYPCLSLAGPVTFPRDFPSDRDGMDLEEEDTEVGPTSPRWWISFCVIKHGNLGNPLSELSSEVIEVNCFSHASYDVVNFWSVIWISEGTCFELDPDMLKHFYINCKLRLSFMTNGMLLIILAASSRSRAYHAFPKEGISNPWAGGGYYTTH